MIRFLLWLNDVLTVIAYQWLGPIVLVIVGLLVAILWRKVAKMTLQGKLKAIGACKEAIEWAEGRKWPAAWQECERGDWMLWLGGTMEGKNGWPTWKEIVLVACDCAELALPTYEKEYPSDSRVRDCIETTRKWTKGEATIEDVRKARTAACAAAWAAEAAAYAATWAAAAYAAYAAAYAAYAAAAAWREKREQKLKEYAAIIRQELRIPVAASTTAEREAGR